MKRINLALFKAHQASKSAAYILLATSLFGIVNMHGAAYSKAEKNSRNLVAAAQEYKQDALEKTAVIFPHDVELFANNEAAASILASRLINDRDYKQIGFNALKVATYLGQKPEESAWSNFKNFFNIDSKINIAEDARKKYFEGDFDAAQRIYAQLFDFIREKNFRKSEQAVRAKTEQLLNQITGNTNSYELNKAIDELKKAIPEVTTEIESFIYKRNNGLLTNLTNQEYLNQLESKRAKKYRLETQLDALLPETDKEASSSSSSSATVTNVNVTKWLEDLFPATNNEASSSSSSNAAHQYNDSSQQSPELEEEEPVANILGSTAQFNQRGNQPSPGIRQQVTEFASQHPGTTLTIGAIGGAALAVLAVLSLKKQS